VNAVALIPARAGSKRVADKNIRRLGGHPVLAYSVAAALESGVFSAVVVSTDSPRYADIARHYGAEVPFLRPAAMAGDLSPDIEWVEHALGQLQQAGRQFDCFSILRPTSPFRTAGTIRRAWDEFSSQSGADSLRAVEKCQQHPGKMWVIRGRRMLPLLPLGPTDRPWHSTPYQDLPEIYVQNASLEIARTRVVFEGRTIAGQSIVPFLTSGHEGHDINLPREWQHAESLIATGEAALPAVPQPPYQDPT
jgi:CMP-N,N'-diacetyllegionaminic acid synthase